MQNEQGQTLVVKGVQAAVKTVTTYNLTVANDHTFFAGDAKVWVHNAGGCCGSQIPVLTNYADRVKLTPINNGRWVNSNGTTGVRGESRFIFNDPDIQKILPNGIKYTNDFPDFTPITLHQVRLPNLITTKRTTNFQNADQALANKLGISPNDVSKFRKDHAYTWYEVEDMRTMQLVPSFIHTGNASAGSFAVKYGHSGGLAEAKMLEIIRSGK